MHLPSPSRRQLISWGLILLGLILVVVFGFNVVRGFLQVQLTGLEPGATDPADVRGWMTVPYVAKVYEGPEDYLFEKIDVPAEGNRKKSLAELNRQYARGQPGTIPTRVREALRNYQQRHPKDTSKP